MVTLEAFVNLTMVAAPLLVMNVIRVVHPMSVAVSATVSMCIINLVTTQPNGV